MRQHLVFKPSTLAALFLVFVGQAGAADINKRFLMGVRLGDFIGADQQSGGFRVFGGFGEGAERSAKIEEVPTLGLSLGYGVAKLGKTQMSLELSVSRVDAGLGPETVYRDRDGSTRVPRPIFFPGPPPVILNVRAPNGDEEFVRLDVGEITLTPVFLTALFHWSGGGGRADFYCGAGPGIVMAEATESADFRSFKSDFDGSDDLAVDDAFGLMVKAGSNVSLKRDGNLMLYFEAEFFSTALFSSEGQVRWNASDYFAGFQDIDDTGDNIPDRFGEPSDLRIVDAGKFRLDGATIGVGLRYRFGGKKVSSTTEEAPESAAPEAP